MACPVRGCGGVPLALDGAASAARRDEDCEGAGDGAGGLLHEAVPAGHGKGEGLGQGDGARQQQAGQQHREQLRHGGGAGV